LPAEAGTFSVAVHLFVDRCWQFSKLTARLEERTMAEEQKPPSGPDLTKGVGPGDFVDDKLLGHVGDEEVLLLRSGGEIFAIGAHCSHYHGPLADGIVTGDSVRCPWHHACFDLRTGEAERAPALSPIDCWAVEQRDGRIFVTQKREEAKPRAMAAKADTPKKIVIVGGGAAGFAAAEMLRRRGFGGSIVMISNDTAPLVVLLFQGAIVLAVIVYIRHLVHHSLLEEGRDLGYRAIVCAHCHHHVMAAGFCPSCGSALGASPRRDTGEQPVSVAAADATPEGS